MKKWTVHFGMRLTYDVLVEANNAEEAIEKASPEWEGAEYWDMDVADTDVDVWEEKWDG